jgi:hypothetical protein
VVNKEARSLLPVKKAPYPLNNVQTGPRAGLNVWEMRKLCRPCRDSNPGSPSQWPSHYTDNAIGHQEGLNVAIKCTCKLYKLHKNPKELTAGMKLFCVVNNTMRE